MLSTIFVAALIGSALAAPTATLEERSTTMCGHWDTDTIGTYIVENDQWGSTSATSGSQCATVNGVTNGAISWSTSWTWAGGPYSVKSYTNVVVKQSTGIKISTITKIPTTWKWSYTGSNLVADVSYDLFTSSTAAGANAYEIMIWLAALGGAGPISSSGSPVATPTISGVKWKLYKGPNGSTTVFSFVAESQVNNFSGDLKLFLAYLSTNQGLSTSQYLKSIGAGTEPFTGSNAVLTTSSYSVVIDT